jgi:hypothetical protein
MQTVEQQEAPSPDELELAVFTAKLTKLAEILDEDGVAEQVGDGTMGQLRSILLDWSFREGMQTLVPDDFSRLDGLLESLGEDPRAISALAAK